MGRLLSWMLGVAAAAFLSGVYADELRVAVISSHDAQPYRETAEAFETYIRANADVTAVERFSLQGKSEETDRVAGLIGTKRTDLILALGQLASRAAVRNEKNSLIISGLVLDSDLPPQSRRSAGITLEHSADLQFNWLKRLIPATQNVGILYEPDCDQDRVEEFETAASKYGLHIVAIPVRSPDELPAALDTLSHHASVLLAIQNPTIYSPQTAKSILLFSFRNRIPLVGLSAAWVKAGALYALTWDYRDLGTQLGELGLKALRGERMDKLPLQRPRSSRIVLNLKTAEHMHVEFRREWIEQAEQVFASEQ